MTREQIDEYILANACEVMDFINEIEIQDILFQYEDNEIIERVNAEIERCRRIKDSEKGNSCTYKLSQEEWDNICTDYRGVWQDYYGEHPEWVGKRTVMSTCITHNSNEACRLLIEGVHFIIE